MDERKINFSPIFFSAFIQALKEIEIPYEYYYGDDKKHYAFTEFLTPMHGDGITREKSEADLIETLRIVAESYCEDIADWKNYEPGKIISILKIIFSSDEELRQCLRGRPLEDI